MVNIPSTPLPAACAAYEASLGAVPEKELPDPGEPGPATEAHEQLMMS